MHRHRQHVADAQPGMRLVGGLAVDADRASGHQRGAIAALTHEPRAPEPLVEALPVAVLGLGDGGLPSASAPPVRRMGHARAPVARPLATGRRRRSGSSMAGAGGPYASAARTSAGTTRKPRRRSTTGSRSAFSEKRDARPAGMAVAPRRVAQASSAATRSAMSSRSSTGPASSQPMASAKPAGQSGWSGSETTSGGGSPGTATPCCTPHSRARMAAARGFSSAGRNRPKRPAFTPIAFSAARACGDSVSPSSPTIRPSASVSRCSRPRNSGCVPPRPASGEQRRQIVRAPGRPRSAAA